MALKDNITGEIYEIDINLNSPNLNRIVLKKYRNEDDMAVIKAANGDAEYLRPSYDIVELNNAWVMIQLIADMSQTLPTIQENLGKALYDYLKTLDKFKDFIEI